MALLLLTASMVATLLGGPAIAKAVDHVHADAHDETAQAVAISVGLAIEDGWVEASGTIVVVPIQGGACAAAGVPVPCASVVSADPTGRVDVWLDGGHSHFVPTSQR